MSTQESTRSDDVGHRFSGFGGHVLFDPAPSIDAGEAPSPLAELGVTDAEQLVAMAAVPGVLEELQAVITGDVVAMVRRARATLPLERAELVGTPAEPDLALGVLPLTDEMVAALETMAFESIETEALELPGATNLIPYMQRIRSQGARGTCVSFALTALNEYVYRRLHPAVAVIDLSEQHLYYEIKLIDGAPAGCGTWQTKAVLALRDRGQCREHVWPYNMNPPCNNHGVRPAAARANGLVFRRPTTAVPARSVQAYKSHMALGRPVTLSIPVYRSWYESAEVRRSGRITMRVGNEQAVGGHAVCLVGYQDSPDSPGGGYFIVRNSWGTTWASASPYSGGYGTIPYRYITNEAMEAFTSVFRLTPGDDDFEEKEEAAAGETTVTIEVGSNVKVTISTKPA